MTTTQTLTASPATEAAIITAVAVRTAASATATALLGQSRRSRAVRDAWAALDAAEQAVTDAVRAHERAVRALNPGVDERTLNLALQGRAA